MKREVTPLYPSLYERLREDPEVIALVEAADSVLAAMGYTDHGARHVTLVARTAACLLRDLNYDPKSCDLAAVSGLLHDIGNASGRCGHAGAGAVLAYHMLTERGVSPEDAAIVMGAIGNHDEIEQGVPVSAPSAALILADKSDIHRSRVRTRQPERFDLHDRINHAVVRSALIVDAEQRTITLRLTFDAHDETGQELRELFAARLAMCRAAAAFLDCKFEIEVAADQP